MKLQTRLTALVSTIIIVISAAIGLFAIVITEQNEIGRIDKILGNSVNQLIDSDDDPLSLALLLADQSDQKFTVSYVSKARDITSLNQSSGDLTAVPTNLELSASLADGVTVNTDGLDRIRSMQLPNDEYVVLSSSLTDIETAKSENIRYLFLFTFAMVLLGILIFRRCLA